MRARVGALDATARAAIGRFLVMIAALGGTVTADEVTMLTKLYRLLGLNGADVYNDLHALATPSSGPVKVRPATARTGGEPLPPPDHATTSPPRPGQTGVPRPSERAVVGPAAPFTLDPELVARRLAESAQVASILADVFEDTDTADGRTVPDRAGTRDAGGGDTAVAGSEDRRDDDGADETIAGLDGAHSRVVATLVSRGDWTWDEFAALCATERLLPDGALDTINEAALDTVDELLVERHGDHLVIDPDTAQELLA